MEELSLSALCSLISISVPGISLVETVVAILKGLSMMRQPFYEHEISTAHFIQPNNSMKPPF